MSQSQASFFPTPPVARARRSDPSTSHLAASGVDVTQTQALVLSAFVRGDATDDELYERICHYWPEKKVTPQSVRSRRSELVSKGLVEFSGNYSTTSNGGKCRVWRRII